MTSKIALVGTGNVAHNVARRLHELNFDPDLIISRDQKRAEDFVNTLSLRSKPTNNWTISRDFDFILLAVPDQVISSVISQFEINSNTIVLHMSGAQPLSLLSVFPKYGVLYPFQTFTKKKEVLFEEIPVFIEGNEAAVTEKILKLARTLSNRVKVVNSENRLKIHLAAVFANNFTNCLFQVSSEILEGTGLDFPVFRHLIYETVENAITISPQIAQTGPAKRGDLEVINRHLDLLQKKHPKYSVLYKEFSNLITQG